MKWNTNLTKRFPCRVPVVGAPMAGTYCTCTILHYFVVSKFRTFLQREFASEQLISECVLLLYTEAILILTKLYERFHKNPML